MPRATPEMPRTPGKVFRNCERCGDEFWIWRSDAINRPRRGRFCSNHCSQQWRKTCTREALARMVMEAEGEVSDQEIIEAAPFARHVVEKALFRARMDETPCARTADRMAKRFAEKLDLERKRRGFSLHDLADVCGFSNKTAGSIISRKADPRLSTVIKICLALGLSIDEIVGLKADGSDG